MEILMNKFGDTYDQMQIDDRKKIDPCLILISLYTLNYNRKGCNSYTNFFISEKIFYNILL